MIHRGHGLLAPAFVFGAPAAFIAATLSTGEARAATINVNTFQMTIAKDGFCSLPEAIVAVNTAKAENECAAGKGDGTDVIQLQATTQSVYAALPATSPLTITKGVTIQGPAPSPVFGPMTVVNANSLTTQGALFKVDDSSGKIKVQLKNLNLSGNSPVAAVLGVGHGHGSTITLSGLIVQNFGASGFSVDGVNLIVQQSDIEFNSASSTFPYGGGILYTDNGLSGTNLVITQSTLANNSAFGGTAGGYGGGLEYLGTGGASSITNSTVSYNQVDGYTSGGLDLQAGGGSFAINACTISYNTCVGVGCGVFAEDDGDDGQGVVYTINATIMADDSDGFPNYNLADYSGGNGNPKETNSMIMATDGSPIVDGGNNYNGQDPGFGTPVFIQELASGGGVYPLSIQALSAGSPAIDKITTLNLTSDERGFQRPVNGRSDIGAFEYDPNTQAEELQIISTSTNPKGTVAIVSNTTYSNGKAAELESTGTGTNSYVVYYGVPCDADGFYNYLVNYATGPNEGKVQLQVSTDPTFKTFTNVGGNLDLYAKTPGFYQKGGYLANASTLDRDCDDNLYFRFFVTGHNASSSGYNVYVDYINPVFVNGD